MIHGTSYLPSASPREDRMLHGSPREASCTIPLEAVNIFIMLLCSDSHLNNFVAQSHSIMLKLCETVESVEKILMYEKETFVIIMIIHIYNCVLCITF